MSSNNFYTFDLSKHNDQRGMMCVAECGKDIPFDIKRFFYDYNNIPTQEHRGSHANRFSKFVFICVSGSCTIEVDDGKNKDTFILDSPQKALFISNMVWKEIYDFSHDSVLLVVSDCFYDSSEYIKEYREFLDEIGVKR